MHHYREFWTNTEVFWKKKLSNDNKYFIKTHDNGHYFEFCKSIMNNKEMSLLPRISNSCYLECLLAIIHQCFLIKKGMEPRIWRKRMKTKDHQREQRKIWPPNKQVNHPKTVTNKMTNPGGRDGKRVVQSGTTRNKLTWGEIYRAGRRYRSTRSGCKSNPERSKHHGGERLRTRNWKRSCFTCQGHPSI